MIQFLKGKLGFNKLVNYLRIESEAAKLLTAKGVIHQMKQGYSQVKDFSEIEFSVFSQIGDDGIIQYLIDKIEIENKFFIEFGVQNYIESNTRFLLMNNYWSGLIYDGSKENIDFIKSDYYYWKYNLKARNLFITQENINESFLEDNVPSEPGILHIDIDGNDYWIWKAIDENKFRARVVIVEFNCNIPDQLESIAIKYSPELDTTVPSINYYGASISAFKKLGELKGYSLIYRVNNHNLFFVDTNLLHEEDINIPIELFLNKEINYTQDRPAKGADESKNVFNYDKKLLHDVFYGEDMQPHWNEYADTSINIWWPQRFDKEWIKV
jgi:hypothetical protein